MSSWETFETAAPDLASVVRACFGVRKHATMATLRQDGSPRISGTEVAFTDGQLVLGSMPGARKARDLQRDPRVAVHSPTVDPPEHDPTTWAGEAKVAGRAVEVGGSEGGHEFHLDLTEVVHTKVAGDRLVVTMWHEGRGVREVSR